MRDLSIPDLQARSAQISEELFNMRLKHSLGQLDNPLQIRTVRRDLARVNTMLAERLREGAQASKG
jgi:large subunit ribosomal protein L29